MSSYSNKYDIIVIGAGHAGCEAGLAAARMGCSVLLMAIDLDKPHRSRSMLGGTYTCPAGANDRTFLAGSYSGWPILDVAVFQVRPRPPKNEDHVLCTCWTRA